MTPLSLTETPLKERLKRQIARTGPIPVSAYMLQCLTDPDHGYYATQRSIGAKADFITAPEISQMFGELIGLWMVSAWQQAGCPNPFRLVELGPGRGTLMRDMVRSIRSALTNTASLEIHLVDISQPLIIEQSRILATDSENTHWHPTIDALPQGPLFIIANEFFDCLPVTQWVRHRDKWHERVIGLDRNGELCFGLGAIRAVIEPLTEAEHQDGAIMERSPASEAVIADLAGKLTCEGGAGLFIDYGYTSPGFGDTFQAVRDHRYADPLAAPGKQDLTAHVNFAALAAAANKEIETCEPSSHRVAEVISQGAFLLSMGLLERAAALGHGKPAEQQEMIRDAVERLAAPDQMGTLFKCMAIIARRASLPPF